MNIKPNLNCECKNRFFKKIVNIKKKPQLEIDYGIKTYNRSIFQCTMCKHVVNDHKFNLKKLYSGIYVKKNYQSIEGIKKPGRPLQDEKSRALILASLGLVDAVIFFSEPTPIKLINQLNWSIQVMHFEISWAEISDIQFEHGRFINLIVIIIIIISAFRRSYVVI